MAIRVTVNRLKCAVVPGTAAAIAEQSGSRTVFEEGVSIPSLCSVEAIVYSVPQYC